MLWCKQDKDGLRLNRLSQLYFYNMVGLFTSFLYGLVMYQCNKSNNWFLAMEFISHLKCLPCNSVAGLLTTSMLFYVGLG